MNNHYCCIASKNHHGPSVQQAVGVRGKYWEPGQEIRIGFVDGNFDQRQFVLANMVEWLKYANLQFVTVPGAYLADAHVRIAFNPGDGSRSYLGTDCLTVPPQRETMNFGWLDRAVVLHEFGHMLGLAHEHQNPDRPINWNKPQVYADLSQAPNYWDRATIDHNIFARYAPGAVDTSPLDKDSVMLYQVPERWTLDGFSAKFNTEISAQDAAFISRIYPKPVEPDPFAAHLRDIFLRRKDLERLTEAVLVRMGLRLGADTKTSLPKPENVDRVAKVLGL